MRATTMMTTMTKKRTKRTERDGSMGQHFCNDCKTSQDSLGRTTIHEQCPGCIAADQHDRSGHVEAPQPNVCWICEVRGLDLGGTTRAA
jgi:hypothetical protein